MWFPLLIWFLFELRPEVTSSPQKELLSWPIISLRLFNFSLKIRAHVWHVMFSYTFQFFFQNSFDCYNSTDNSLYPSLHPNKRHNVQFWKDRFTYTFIGRSCISSFLLIIEFILPVPGASWEAAKSRSRLTACFKSDFNLKFDGSFLSLPRCFKMFSLAFTR